MKRKTLSKWVKTEKRIVRLMYRAGLLDNHFVGKQWFRGRGYVTVKPSDVFHWAYYHQLHKLNWNKTHRGLPPYMPEVHYVETDYYGESDEHAVTHCLDWGGLCNCPIVDEDTGEYYPPCKHWKRVLKSRYKLIEELKRLPEKRNDHAINPVIKQRQPE